MPGTVLAEPPELAPPLKALFVGDSVEMAAVNEELPEPLPIDINCEDSLEAELGPIVTRPY